MSTLQEAVAACRLDDALDIAKAGVLDDPEDVSARALLVELLCVKGDWQRASGQLDVIRRLSDEHGMFVVTLQTLIDAERYRDSVYAGEQAPVVFGEPPVWLAKLVEAVRVTRHDPALSAALHAQAMEAAPPVSGSVNGVPFEWWLDTDERISPLIEFVSEGKLYWSPLHHLSKLVMEPPQQLSDLVWQSATLTSASGGEIAAYLPARYANASAAPSDQHRFGRQTDWMEVAEGVWGASGQKTYASSAGDYAMLEIRELEFAGWNEV